MDSFTESYAKKNFIDEGSFSTCYLGQSTSDNKTVVLKIAKTEDKKSHLKDEADILPYVSQVSGICKMLNYYPEEGCLVLERFAGDCLYDVINSQLLSESDMKTVFINLVNVIEQLHKLKVVHNDIKPENVLINSNLEIRLIDFGLAYISEDGKVLEKMKNKGSPNYLAPERFDPTFEVTDAFKTDIWSLGVSLFVMMSKKFPYVAYDFKQRIMKEKVFPDIFAASYMVQNFSRSLINLLESMLKGNPQDRIDLNGIRCHPWLKK